MDTFFWTSDTFTDTQKQSDSLTKVDHCVYHSAGFSFTLMEHSMGAKVGMLKIIINFYQ